MKPTLAHAEEAATMLNINTWELHLALRSEAVATMKRAADKFASYADDYGSDIARARRLDAAATVCFEAWEALQDAKTEVTS
jgi:spore cortex formation protein SpoVR/YcgB (stage V sporulation)